MEKIVTIQDSMETSEQKKVLQHRQQYQHQDANEDEANPGIGLLGELVGLQDLGDAAALGWGLG